MNKRLPHVEVYASCKVVVNVSKNINTPFMGEW
jgi:hypothetical protein